MTRDQAYAHWAASGLTLSQISWFALVDLRSRIQAAFRSSAHIADLRADRLPVRRPRASNLHAQITCSASYFKKRDAVSFLKDGSISFASWADDCNLTPILTAFCAWVDSLKKTCEK